MTQLKLWKFSANYWRMGDVEGLFIATEEEVDKFLDKRNVCLGEVLGKHSEVDVYFEKGKNLKCLDISEFTINELFLALDSRSISGHNPFESLYDSLKCTNCDFEGGFDDWYDTRLIAAYFYCPECGSEDYKTEDGE